SRTAEWRARRRVHQNRHRLASLDQNVDFLGRARVRLPGRCAEAIVEESHREVRLFHDLIVEDGLRTITELGDCVLGPRNREDGEANDAAEIEVPLADRLADRGHVLDWYVPGGPKSADAVRVWDRPPRAPLLYHQIVFRFAFAIGANLT